MIRIPHLRHSVRPGLEPLEERSVPAVFGQPWSDPEHLTLSFAPDGTSLAGQTSQLFRSLDAQMPRATWQRAVLQSIQTWVARANLDVGVVGDSGQPFGATGRTQGDLRFGDIRIGALPMSGDALAVAVPHDPLLSGTWTGDVFLNSSARFTSATLSSVLLHEVGHVLGLPENADRRSVMYPVLGPAKTFTVQDVTQVQGLYGQRTPDVWEGSKGNDSLRTATRLEAGTDSGSRDGRVPLVAFGNVTTMRDLDTYWIRPISGYTGPMTIRLRSAGLSLLAPSLTILDQNGRVLGRGVSTDARGGTVTLRLAQVSPAARYYLRVQGATHNAFGVGRYALVISHDRLVRTTPGQLETFLRTAPSELSRSDQDTIEDPGHALLQRDNGDDDSFESADTPQPTPLPSRTTRYEVLGTIESGTDTDLYRIRAPKRTSNSPLVLVVSLNSTALNGLVPRITVLDERQVPLATQVLVNGNGTLTVQVIGVTENKDVYLRVSSPAGRTGNYALRAEFGDHSFEPQSYAVGSLSATQTPRNYQVHLAHSQLMQFTLSATATAGVPATAIRFDLRNARGQLVLSLRAHHGETFTASSLFLPPGAYTATLTLEPGVSGTAPQAGDMLYRLQGFSQSNPIGPALVNPLLTPQYTAPYDPTLFIYPGTWSSRDPIFWLLMDPSGYLLVPGPTGNVIQNAYPVINGSPLLTRP